MDEILLMQNDDGEFEQIYTTIIIPTEEDFKHLTSLTDRDNGKPIIRIDNKTIKCPECNYEMKTEYANNVPYFCSFCGQRIYAPLDGYDYKQVLCKHTKHKVIIGTQCKGCRWLEECSK